jgi:predicted histidine transporter YuiF (NhaC family)
MNRRRIFFILAVIGLLLSIVFQMSEDRLYDNIPEVLTEQNKAQWLERRDFYSRVSIISDIAATTLLVAGLVSGRSKLKQ